MPDLWLVLLGIYAVYWLFSGVAKAIQKAREEEELRQFTPVDDDEPPVTRPQAPSQSTRAQPNPEPRAQATDEPVAATMAERIERARARAQQQPGTPPAPTAPQQAPAPASRRQTLQQQRVARQRMVAAQARAQMEARRKALQQQQQRPDPTRSRRPARPQPPETARRAPAQARQPARPQPKPQPVVEAVALPDDAHNGLHLTPDSLRRVLIMKELLDPPLALRDPSKSGPAAL